MMKGCIWHCFITWLLIRPVDLDLSSYRMALTSCWSHIWRRSLLWRVWRRSHSHAGCCWKKTKHMDAKPWHDKATSQHVRIWRTKFNLGVWSEAINTELNDLRKLFFREKLKFLSKEFQFIKSLKIWWSMADIAMLHQIFNEFILSAMLLHQWRQRSVTIATTELSNV